MSRVRMFAVVAVMSVGVGLLCMYTFLNSEPPPSKLVAKFDQRFQKQQDSLSELSSTENYASSTLQRENRDGNLQADDEAEYDYESEQENLRKKRNRKRKKQRQRNEEEDYTVATRKSKDADGNSNQGEGLADESEAEESANQKSAIMEEQRRQVAERNNMEQLKMQLEDQKKILNRERQKLNEEKRKVLEWKEAEFKNIQGEKEQIRMQKERLEHDKSLATLKERRTQEAQKTQVHDHKRFGVEVMTNIYSEEELNNMLPADKKDFKGLDSKEVHGRYPGITFLPEYHLQEFVEPDSHGRARTLDDISEYEAEERFYRLISQNQLNCAEVMRMGNVGDGGWDICTSEPYKPSENNCLVYSFGINNDFTFDDAMANQFKCNVHAFDPSMNVGDHKHAERVWFYQLGLGAANTVNAEMWKIETLGSILSKNHHLDKIIDVLKIDIEYNEWSCFKTMLKEGVLRNVRQLVFEIHTSELYNINRPSTKQDFNDMYAILLAIEKAGFRRYHYHYNPYGKYLSIRSGKQRTCCYELSYVNLNFIELPSS